MLVYRLSILVFAEGEFYIRVKLNAMPDFSLNNGIINVIFFVFLLNVFLII